MKKLITIVALAVIFASCSKTEKLDYQCWKYSIDTSGNRLIDLSTLHYKSFKSTKDKQDYEVKTMSRCELK